MLTAPQRGQCRAGPCVTVCCPQLVRRGWEVGDSLVFAALLPQGAACLSRAPGSALLPSPTQTRPSLGTAGGAVLPIPQLTTRVSQHPHPMAGGDWEWRGRQAPAPKDDPSHTGVLRRPASQQWAPWHQRKPQSWQPELKRD